MLSGRQCRPPVYQTPSPTHGYFPAVAAFWAYVALAGTAGLAAWAFGVPVAGALLAFLLAALALLKPFLPVFRRLLPDASDRDGS